jgi:predicted phage tail protein
MNTWFRTFNIEIGPVKVTGGSALIVLGAALIFLLGFVMDWLGAGIASPYFRYGLGGLLIALGVLWFFWTKPEAKKGK